MGARTQLKLARIAIAAGMFIIVCGVVVFILYKLLSCNSIRNALFS